jgi:hypothetical protein
LAQDLQSLHRKRYLGEISFGYVAFALVNANARYHAVFARFPTVIMLRHRTNPLHAEILECKQQPSEITPLNFHIL